MTTGNILLNKNIYTKSFTVGTGNQTNIIATVPSGANGIFLNHIVLSGTPSSFGNNLSLKKIGPLGVISDFQKFFLSWSAAASTGIRLMEYNEIATYDQTYSDWNEISYTDRKTLPGDYWTISTLANFSFNFTVRYQVITNKDGVF